MENEENNGPTIQGDKIDSCKDAKIFNAVLFQLGNMILICTQMVRIQATIKKNKWESI